MERLLLKAHTSAVTDEGIFTAVISAASIDREKDIVDPAGMVRALHKWIATGKNIPLAWNHSTAPEHQIGYIDPKSARVQGGEVVADGFIDQSIDAGAHAWRQVKAGTLGFSFGYLTLQSAPRKGGGRLLKELDVFEVTASPTPMNNDTRVVGWKAAAEVEEQEQDTLETVIELMGDFLDTEDDQQDIARARDIIARLQALLASESAETPGKAASSLRAKADAVALEHASGGQNLKPAPATAAEPEPEPERGKSLAELFTDDELQALLAPEAKARIAQSDLPQEVKDKLAGKAQRLLDDQQKSVDGTAKARGRAVDPLRAKAEALALEHASGGQSLQKSPPQETKAPTPDLLPLRELKARMRAEMLTALSGGTET